MNESKSLKAKLSSIFTRKGSGGQYTRLFQDLELFQQKLLLKNIQLNEGELPVIGSAESQDKWLIITTERIVWCRGGKTQALSVLDIRDAVADLDALQTIGRPKLQIRELQIETISHEQYTIEVEEGSPLSGVWNVLKNLGARNRRMKKAD